MAISEAKMKIVIDNYFKTECDVNTSIRKAFEKGFRIGVQKGMQIKKESLGNSNEMDNVSEVEQAAIWEKPEEKQEYYQSFCSRCGRPVIARKEDAFWWPGGTSDDHLCIECEVCGGLAEV